MTQKNYRIKNFPISFFAVSMGLTGLVISLQKASVLININKLIIINFLYIDLLIFTILSLIYLNKFVKFKNEVKKEFNNPIKINFFPSFSISLILFSISFLDINLEISKYFWLTGTILHLFFTLSIISAWIQKQTFKIQHMNPSWFIPAVGNILIPIAGIYHFSPEISWFFFSVGLILWLILMVIFFNRIFFHDPLPEKLLPTLFILIAPPAIGFISYYKIVNEINDFAKILYFFALFISILIFFQAKIFKNIKYYLSWWAYSFPIASISIASFIMYQVNKITLYKYLHFFFLLFLIILVLFLSYKTIKQALKRKICVEE
ncbi:MAG: SLAC1 anion channel family protein [Candidatus Pacebacteria bacterium]|nr:SLAC1 anion channel family protein [Candidatus Paceibacterota bacterium]